MTHSKGRSQTTDQLEAIVEAHLTIVSVAVEQFDLARRKLEQARKKEKQSGLITRRPS